MKKPLTLIASAAGIIILGATASCGGGASDGVGGAGIQLNALEPRTIGPSSVDSAPLPGPGQVVSQLLDAAVGGLPYASTSAAGGTYVGKTNSIGQFLAYPGGVTSFQIGSVNLGNWHEPAITEGGGGSVVQLSGLDYGQSSCASPDANSTARILSSLNSTGNSYQQLIPTSATLRGCPSTADFFVQNGLSTSAAQASAHISQTESRVEVQRKIAAALFSIPLSDIDAASVGANYTYNDYGANPEDEKTCTGYANGHAGVDFQTKDVAGSLTADRDVYFLTDGKVLKTDSTNGRVIVSAKIAVNSATEDVKIGYLHLRTINVVEGVSYRKGEKLGIQGNLGLGLKSTDTTSQEHVHVEIRSADAPTGAACGANPKDRIGTLDPLQYFAAIVSESSAGTPTATSLTFSRSPIAKLVVTFSIDMQPTFFTTGNYVPAINREGIWTDPRTFTIEFSSFTPGGAITLKAEGFVATQSAGGLPLAADVVFKFPG